MKNAVLNRRRFLGVGAATVGSSLGYAHYLEPYWLEVNRIDMPILGLPSNWIGKKVVHATDLHISPEVSDDYMLQVFETVEQQHASLVLYTGDFVSSSSDLERHVPSILARAPRGELGAYTVLGNHDYGPHFESEAYAETVSNILKDRDIQVLRNEHVDLDGLTLVGIDDLWADRCNPQQALQGMNRDTPAITLLHNPDGVELEGWDNYSSWILCGHTHGGQCRLPLLPPPRLPIYHRKYANGQFSLSGGRHLYVSKGVGHSLRLRFCVRPEITVFTLRSA